ncbi:YybH family protein [Thalassotalea mangrovi]|uniref:DUF4440 domain-containing protein n=1 Tax=Thalassotalea mangrovi TaxID=2572245 RepID=A0A4U1B3X1_9GAMM|nr:DUF4440 domain-containing protein [Thalassotalea mangrovi]TKB44535.1 DUF4440 domain-containing protein [Thalassotalea mangrovi]
MILFLNDAGRLARLSVLIALSLMIQTGHANDNIDAKAVWESELAFAKTMADRDLSAFSEFIADDAVFISEQAVHRGKQQVVEAWSKLFANPEAPFAWRPERVEVLDNGGLALSTGPVWNQQGRFHTYTSIWRKEANGRWKVIFDKGDRFCR